MRFVFDYGDEWEFVVELVKRKPKEPKVKLPRLLISAGEAPAQYPDRRTIDSHHAVKSYSSEIQRVAA
jgi:hypothetical protein